MSPTRQLSWWGAVLMTGMLNPAVAEVLPAREAFFAEKARSICASGAGVGREISKGRLPLGNGRSLGFLNYVQENGDIIRLYEQSRSTGARLIEFYEHSDRGPRALFSAKLDATCVPLEGREIAYDVAGRAQEIHWLGRGLRRIGKRLELNPPVPPAADTAGVRVALIDSGVNYLVPAIARALARDPQGKILGYDFREMDDRPFDVDPLKHGPFEPVHHGTSVASVLLTQGEGAVSLVPYSFPGTDSRRFKLLVDDLRKKKIKIANLSIGSSDVRAARPWQEIGSALKSAPEILFVVAAGNEGNNTDIVTHYPSAFKLPNVIVVGAVDVSGSVSAGSNYGLNVDVAAIADPVDGRGFAWQPKALYGTSFAAPIVSALAAKLLQSEPEMDAVGLKRKICSLASPVSGERKTACGFIRL